MVTTLYLCPAALQPYCRWEGPADEIKPHFEKEHRSLLFNTNSVEIDLGISHENRLLHLRDEIYLVQSTVENNKLFLKLRYLGPISNALRKRYDVRITVNNTSYKYEADTKERVVRPNLEGWEVNLEQFHDQRVRSLICTVLVRDDDSDLKINNRFVERNVCDSSDYVNEDHYLDALSLVEGKLKALKRHDREDDLMDKISQLNLSILEEPFPRSRKPSIDSPRWDGDASPCLVEMLPEIREESGLSCTSCKVDMLPPIYLCVNGHSVCSPCQRSPCRECGAGITERRNSAMEESSRNVKHPCRYALDGCLERLLYSEVRGHEARCQFCKYRCRAADCNYEGKFQHFLEHLRILHTSLKICKGLSVEFPKNSEFYIANQGKGVFYCKSECVSESIVWRTFFCGPRERNFFCEMLFKGSKLEAPLFLKRLDNNVYETRMNANYLKKNKAKAKNAILIITSLSD